MGWFRSRDDAGSARDPELPLTESQAQRLRELVRVAWATEGREVTVHSDCVVDADGATFGLWNLAVSVADEPNRKWPSIVAAHVRRLATAEPSVDALSDDELRSRLVLRLAASASLPEPAWFATAPTLADDLRELLVLDFPETVVTPHEADFAARGDLDEWRAVGRANLWHMMRSEPREHHTLARGDGGHFEALMGDSVYTASMAIFLPELLSLAGFADAGRGVLVTVPFRHQVAFRVIDGPEAALALTNLFRFGIAGYNDGAGPLSPHVYWVKDARWTRITDQDEDGAKIMVSPELAEALELTE